MMDVERVEAVPSLARRAVDGHKGRYGTVLAIAGSRGMAGAAGLVGKAALRSGAGLVRVMCPSEITAIVAGYEPSYMTGPLRGDESGRLCDMVNRPELTRAIEAATAVAIGPGLGRSRELDSLVGWLAEAVDRPLVMDADALNALGESWAERLRGRPAATILTPHPGELSRLSGQAVESIQKDREGAVVAAARRAGEGESGGVVVVLKGHQTVVSDGRRLYRNTTGNPGMATGGTGDVLTGVIAGLVGQGMPAFEAAVLGVYTHGRAGDLARRELGEVGLIASDLLATLPMAWTEAPAGGSFGF